MTSAPCRDPSPSSYFATFSFVNFRVVFSASRFIVAVVVDDNSRWNVPHRVFGADGIS